MASSAAAGSQRWLQMAINREPMLLLDALRRSGAVTAAASMTWSSPLESERFQEYRNGKALAKVGIAQASLKRPLAGFWPARGETEQERESRLVLSTFLTTVDPLLERLLQRFVLDSREPSVIWVRALAGRLSRAGQVARNGFESHWSSVAVSQGVPEYE
jgi:hypothetical protein